jgi:hypothetical protein
LEGGSEDALLALNLEMVGKDGDLDPLGEDDRPFAYA